MKYSKHSRIRPLDILAAQCHIVLMIVGWGIVCSTLAYLGYLMTKVQ